MLLPSWSPSACFRSLSINGEAETIEDIRSLSVRSPLLAGAFTVACASLAGLPLAAGFFGKFYVLAAIVRSGTWALAATLVVTSGIGIYYYFRIMNAMFERPAREARRTARRTRRSGRLSRRRALACGDRGHCARHLPGTAHRPD